MKAVCLYFALAIGIMAATKPAKFIGQAFAGGVDQPYRFAGMVVGLYNSPPATDSELPKAVVKTMTDADGRFTLSTPGRHGILYARAVRNYRTGSKALYEWTLDISAMNPDEPLMLTGENAKITPMANLGPYWLRRQP